MLAHNMLYFLVTHFILLLFYCMYFVAFPIAQDYPEHAYSVNFGGMLGQLAIDACAAPTFAHVLF